MLLREITLLQVYARITSTIRVQMAWLRSHTEDPGANWLKSLIRIAAKNILEEEAPPVS